MNIAFVAKLGWRLLNERDSLWARVLISKYARHRTGKDMFQSTKGDSNVWKGITNAMQLVGTSFIHKINSGTETKFWLDTWVGEEPLINFIQDVGALRNMHAAVADMWDDMSGWKWDHLPNLPANIVSYLHLLVLDRCSSRRDEVYWKHKPSGKFSVASAYNMIKGVNSNLQEKSWSMIWKLKVPSKIKLLLWTMSHDRVLGNAERKRRGLTADGSCPICSGHEETTDHIFRSCIKAKRVWNDIGVNMNTNSDGEVKNWIYKNVSQKIHSNIDSDWGITFATACWWIWRWRNARIFSGEELEDKRKISWIKEAVREINTAFRRHRMVGNIPNSVDCSLRWKMSQDCEWTLNVDGSCKTFIDKAGIGGVLRNSRGEWKGGFTAKARERSATSVEVMAISAGIQWAWEQGVRELEIQTDAGEAVKWIAENNSLRGPTRHIIDNIKKWQTKYRRIKIKSIFREQNLAADHMASIGAFQHADWIEHEVPPPGMEDIITRDKIGVTRIRRVTSPEETS
ncbi:unnamed protein product [Cuscuta campestris]|uniref:Uncharacterized protein n=1 Tax=Cuscuta campestris TaxID=132261 RepID=A0A484LYR2_9ASTE|nr:unnamed protein product [Cuscuta campestris]